MSSTSETQPLLSQNAQPEGQPSASAVHFGAKIGRFSRNFTKSPLLVKAIERTSTTFYDAATFEGSIWPAAIGPAIALTIWATLIVSIYELTDWLGDLPNSIYFITVIGVAFGYLMVFRTNTAYERFWEGRRLWSQLQIQIVNFGRIIWVHTEAPVGKKLSHTDSLAKKGAMNLLVALAISIKYHLRGEPGIDHEDLKPYLEFIPELSDGISYSSLPLDIILHLGAYLIDVKEKGLLDGGSYGTLTGTLSAFIDTLTYFERICYTPIPRAYHVYIKQTLLVYIASLPFQITQILHWWAIPVVLFGGGTLLGMEAIAREIENPFGTDFNDLPQDDYIRDIRKDLVSIMKTPKIEVDKWGVPCDLEKMDEPPVSRSAKPIIIVN